MTESFDVPLINVDGSPANFEGRFEMLAGAIEKTIANIKTAAEASARVVAAVARLRRDRAGGFEVLDVGGVEAPVRERGVGVGAGLDRRALHRRGRCG